MMDSVTVASVIAMVTGITGMILGIRSEWRAFVSRRRESAEQRAAAFHALSLVVHTGYNLPFRDPTNLTIEGLHEHAEAIHCLAQSAREAVDSVRHAFPDEVLRLRDIALIADQLTKTTTDLPAPAAREIMLTGFSAIFGALHILARLIHTRSDLGGGLNDSWARMVSTSLSKRFDAFNDAWQIPETQTTENGQTQVGSDGQLTAV